MESRKLLSIITVTYNSIKEIGACLDAVRIPYDERIEIVLIDNVSTDGTIDLLKKNYSQEKNIKIICNDENIGFARGCNQGVALTTGTYILLLNPDTVAPVEGILRLVDYLDNNPEVGIVGPKIIDEAGTIQESYGYDLTPGQEIIGKFFYSRYLEIIPSIKKWKDAQLMANTTREVGWIGGACTLVRRELYEKVGGIDEHYFLSHADMIDLGKSIKNLGYMIILYPEVVIMHAGSKSIVKNRDIVLERAYRGTLYFFRKYYGRGTVILIKIIYVLLSLVKGVVSLPVALFVHDPYWDIARAHFKNAFRIIVGKIS